MSVRSDFHHRFRRRAGGRRLGRLPYHYLAKVGYEVLSAGSSPWSVVVNAGAGALTFDPDGAASKTYPAINVGARIGYRLSPRVSLLLSPQGAIAFTKDDELGTDNAWVWPFTAGVRLAL